jgi:phage I-like protein
VEWTDKGRALIEDRAYKAISPALIFDRMLPKKIAKLGNASLVNRPNLREMTSLHQMEFEMDLAARLAKLLGLSDGASDEAIIAAINDKKPSGNTELQSAVNDIGVALGCDAGADTNAILTAARQATPQNEVVALQSQVATLSGELDTLKQEGARKAAEDLVDAGIADCRVGLNAESRDRYINLCMSDMDMGRDLIAGLPKLSGEVLPDTPPAEGGAVSLNAEEIAVADQLGLSHADFAAQRDKEAS